MKRFLILALVLICSPAFATLNNPLSDTYPELGEGCTNARYIDKDCDGYGVGYEYVTGPDADDTDATVNDTDSVVDKYGDVETFVDSKYTCDYYAFVSVGGTRTGSPSSSWSTAIADPYNAWNTVVGGGLEAGECVIYRSGTTHTTRMYVGSPGAWKGTALKPIVIMAYPGELPIWDPETTMTIASATSAVGPTGLVVDGFLFYDTLTQWLLNYSSNVTFRNNEWNTTESAVIYSFGKLNNWLIEDNLAHDNGRNDFSGSDHIFYIGNRCESPNSKDDSPPGWVSCTWLTSDNVKIEGNVFYRGSFPDGDIKAHQRDIQFNGYVTNFEMRENIFDGSEGYSHVQLVNGVNGIVENNVFLGGATGNIRVGFYVNYGPPVYAKCGTGATYGAYSYCTVGDIDVGLEIRNNSFHQPDLDEQGVSSPYGIRYYNSDVGMSNDGYNNVVSKVKIFNNTFEA
ncbi:MAG: hypothetical protein ACYTEU_09135 [Planctomycetota bacterium]|jgi:hypothetical protein